MGATNTNYLIYGAGGHAKVLKDLLSVLATKSEILCYFNDSDEPKELAGIPVKVYDPTQYLEGSVILGIGNGKVRKLLAEKVKHPFATLVHPSASVAADAELGEGTVILAGAVVQAGSKIGKHVIINANVTVDHDAIVSDYVTTYPGVYLGAESHIAEGTTINSNAVVMRFMKTEAYTEIEPGKIIS